MTDRERLSELFEEITRLPNAPRCAICEPQKTVGEERKRDCKTCVLERNVDYFIANGVTIRAAARTNIDRIKNMTVEELANFICDIYASNEHREIRVDGRWMFPEDVEEWLESEGL